MNNKERFDEFVRHLLQKKKCEIVYAQPNYQDLWLKNPASDRYPLIHVEYEDSKTSALFAETLRRISFSGEALLRSAGAYANVLHVDFTPGLEEYMHLTNLNPRIQCLIFEESREEFQPPLPFFFEDYLREVGLYAPQVHKAPASIHPAQNVGFLGGKTQSLETSLPPVDKNALAEDPLAHALPGDGLTSNFASIAFCDAPPSAPAASDFQQNVPATYDFQPNIPVTYDVQQNVPATYDVQQDVPAMNDFQPNIPVTYDVQQNVPVMSDFQQDVWVTGDVQQDVWVTGDVQQNVPAMNDFQPNIPVTYDVQQNVPVTGNVQPNIPATSDVQQDVWVTSDVQQDVPATYDVQQNVPAMSDVQQDVPVTGNVQQDVPVTYDVQQDVPVTGNVQPNIPVTNAVQQDVPAMNDFQPNIPATYDVQQDVPAMNDFQQDVPATSDFQQDVPAMNDFQQDVPAMSDFPQNVPATYDFQPNIPATNDTRPSASAVHRFQSNIPVTGDFQKDSLSTNLANSLADSFSSKTFVDERPSIPVTSSFPQEVCIPHSVPGDSMAVHFPGSSIPHEPSHDEASKPSHDFFADMTNFQGGPLRGASEDAFPYLQKIPCLDAQEQVLAYEAPAQTKRSYTFREIKNRKPYPKIILVLVALNIHFLFSMSLKGNTIDTELDYGAVFGPYVMKGEIWRFFTHMYLHANFAHLLGNLLILVLVGYYVVRIFGSWKTLVIYTLSGILGGVCSFAFSPLLVVSLGASGAIFGLIGCLLYNSLVNRETFHKMMGALLLLVAITKIGAGFYSQGIDNYGHIGGFLGGFLTSGVLGLPNQESIRRQTVCAGVFLFLFVLFYVLGHYQYHLLNKVFLFW